MTVLIPELAAGGAETGAVAEGVAERGIGARARERASQRARETVQGAPGYYAGQGRELSRGRLVPGSRNYQPVILAEFLAAVLIVAFAPLATGGGTSVEPPESHKVKGQETASRPSPYHVNDMVQLVSVAAVYFVLALLSSGPRSGRIAAWFGGLVLAGLIFRKFAGGELQAVVTNLGGGPPQAPGPGTQNV